MQFCVQQVSIGTRSRWEESQGVGGVTLRDGRSHTRGVGGITLRGWVESHSVMPVSTNYCAPKTQYILPSLLVSGEGVPAFPPPSRGDHQGGLPTAQGTPTSGQCNGAHCSCGYSLCGVGYTYIHMYICMYMWVSSCVVYSRFQNGCPKWLITNGVTSYMLPLLGLHHIGCCLYATASF